MNKKIIYRKRLNKKPENNLNLLNNKSIINNNINIHTNLNKNIVKYPNHSVAIHDLFRDSTESPSPSLKTYIVPAPSPAVVVMEPAPSPPVVVMEPPPPVVVMEPPLPPPVVVMEPPPPPPVVVMEPPTPVIVMEPPTPVIVMEPPPPVVVMEPPPPVVVMEPPPPVVVMEPPPSPPPVVVIEPTPPPPPPVVNTPSYNNINNVDILNSFKFIYNINSDTLLKDPKVEFRLLCFTHLKYIQYIELPTLSLNLENEAVLIEFRYFPHIEFTLRNAIIKLGNKWSYTIVCGNLNYNLVKDIIKNISPNIKIINSNYDSIDINDYSKILTSVAFWNMFVGKKILIYQEDAYIFKNNINMFMNFDYIGAPWKKSQNDTPNCVGNGGFSLRTKQVMIDVINAISPLDTTYNSSTLQYMRNCKITFPPEDVYFSKNIQELNIGRVANWEISSLFSSESICNLDSFGGHNIWVSDPNWKKRVYEHNIIQFKPMYDETCAENHRGGWGYVIDNLLNNKFYSKDSDIYFFDMVEHYFLWRTNYSCLHKWCGIIHCTEKTPSYFEIVNINHLFENKNFIKSLHHCFLLITLAPNVAIFLEKKLKEYNFKIKVITIKHPCIFENIPRFSIEKYINNNNKKIIQVGQQLRKLTSIYRIKNTTHKKIWLTGNKDLEKCNKMLNTEIKHFNIDTSHFNQVQMKYTTDFEEYDTLLSENIVLIHFFDTAANNSVLECIVRNTPIIVNKLPGLVYYLGENYPLYFSHIDEVEDLLQNNRLILDAHNYLKNMDKSDITIEYFNKKLYTGIHNALGMIS